MGIFDYETCETHSRVCPYCQNEEQYGGDPLGDQDTTEEVCNSCGKTYTIKMEASYQHECYKKEDLK